jgi:protein TonB
MVVLVLALLAAAYFGYTKFFASKHTSQPPVQPPPMTSAPPQPSVPTQSQAADSTATTIAQTPAQSQPDPEPATSRPTRPDVSIASSDAPEVVIERQPVSPKLVVKSDLGSSRPARTPAPASAETVDAPEIGNLANSDASAISTMMKSAAPVSTPVGPKEVIRVSQGVTQGLLLKRVQPVYPQAAMQMRVQGAVQLQAVIGKTGSVSNIKLLSGDPVLGKAAIQAVSQWKYKPYYLDGEPVDIQTQVTVNFKLP